MGPSVQKRSQGRLALGLALVGALSFAANGCDRRGQSRAEARQLLAALNAVSDEHSLAQRSAALQALQSMPVHDERHRAARAACHTAHLDLLEAETHQTAARKALSEASAGKLSPGDAASIAADIERSNQALAEAKRRFPRCEQAMRDLLAEAH